MRSSSVSPAASRSLKSAVWGPQLLVAHRDEVVLDGVDLLGHGSELAKDLAFTDAEHLVEQCGHERGLLVAGAPPLATGRRRAAGRRIRPW
jgi:hypothetical protein